MVIVIKTYRMKITSNPIILILISMFTLLLSCEPDTQIITEEIALDGENSYPLNTSIIELADVPEVKSFLENNLGKRNGASWQTNKGGNGTIVQTSFGQIPLEHIMEVLDTTGRANYTFRVLPNTYFENRFYNLIVHKNENKGKMSAFVLEYEMTDAYAAAYREGNADFSSFTGNIRRYTLDDFLQSGKSSKTNKGMFCSEEDTNPTEDTGECEEITLIDGFVSTDNGDTNDGDTNDPSGHGETDGSPTGSGGGSSGGGTMPVICAPGGLYLTGCKGTNSSDMHKASDCGGPNKAGATYYMGLVCTDGSEIAPTNKSASNVGEDCDTGDGTVAISPVPFHSLSIALGLTPFESLCLNDKCDTKNEINNYLKQNINADGQYDADALSFGSAVAKTLVENDCNDDFEVDWDDEIIKDKSFLNTKADCVLESLMKQTGDFKDVMDSFTNNNSEYKIRFTTGQVRDNADAQTSAPDANGIITITVSPATAAGRDLEIAGILLHEGIHAQLQRIIVAGNKASYNFSDAQYTWLLDLNEWWIGKSSFPVATAQHDFMAVLHVEPIAKAVKKLDSHLYPLNNYMYFGWEGLFDEGSNRGLITMSTFNELTALAQIPLTDNHKTICE